MTDASGTSASIEDVARLAGVSIATVSRSLRGLPEVAPSTRDRVLVAARELDYVASPFAARLASGRTFTVGVVVPFVDRWFFATVLGAVEAVFGRAGFDLLLYNLADAAGRDRFFTALPVRKRVDAVLLVSLALNEQEIDAMRGLGVPIGVVGAEVTGFHGARIDDIAGAQAAVRHLIDRGHSKIGLIGGDTDDAMRFTPPLFRRDGYLRALAAADITPEARYEQLGYFTTAGGETAMTRLLALPGRPTAIFAESDEMAYGAIRAIRRAGLQVPQDIAVIGFDDHDSAHLLDLSTVSQPVLAQATVVAQALLAAIGGTNVEATCTVEETDLIVRGSTDPSRSVFVPA